MPISPVEHELWKIFTYYTLHSDPMQPEHLRVAHFMRFAKDCQIISPHLMAADIQIMMTREVRNKRIAGGDDGSAGYVTFYDFISLINMLAPKVYTDSPSPEIALRRLLLENVLLLAGRRVPADTNLDVTNAEAVEVLKGKFGRAILNIYKHYADMAHRRHGQEIAAEKARRREAARHAHAPGPATGGGPASSSDAIQPTPYSSFSNSEMKEVLKKLADTIGYVEFFKFANDFKLKSTALLTAIQVGDVFLTCVPLEEDNRDLRVMTFDTFCQAIILMALVAYRDAPAPVTPANKVKALLLFMWRSVNSSEKTAKAVNDRYGVSSRTVEGHAGSLNIYGSGMFSDQFMHAWQSEGFPSYTTVDAAKEDSVEVLHKVVNMHTSTSKANDEIEDIMRSAGRSPGKEKKASAPKVSRADSSGAPPAVIYGYQVAELFLRKPELAELIYLELCNSRNEESK